MKDILEGSIRFVPVILIMGTIFFLSHQPATDLQFLPDIPGLDKLVHGIVYGCLAAAALYAAPQRQLHHRPQLVGVVVVLFCVLYGVSDEFHQSFIPGREPSIGDLVADTLGATFLTCIWIKGRRQTETKNR